MTGQEALEKLAWTEGLARTEPHENHRNTDVVLYILADYVDAEVINYSGCRSSQNLLEAQKA